MVVGVDLVYLEVNPKRGEQQGAIYLGQVLGSKASNYRVGNATKTGVESLRGRATDVWAAENVNGVPQSS